MAKVEPQGGVSRPTLVFNRARSYFARCYFAGRALLLKEALEEINKMKRSRYETWRRKALAGSRIVPRFMRLLVATVIPALVCLQVRQPVQG